MRHRLLLAPLMFVLALGNTGCFGHKGWIDHASITLSPNLANIRASIIFTDRVRSDLSGSFPIKDYGNIFINPYTTHEPFEVGLNLNTDVVGDGDWIHIHPTLYLPNGVPIGIDYPIVQLAVGKDDAKYFDMYGYIDIAQQAWLGLAVMLGFVNDKWFPAGTAVKQVFLRDSEGRPAMMTEAFGPAKNPDGSEGSPGGFAVFVNVKQLTQYDLAPGGVITLYPEEVPEVTGDAAPLLQHGFASLLSLERGMVDGLNSIH